MGDWTSILNADPIPWLLENDNPSVRYFTLMGILERPENYPEVKNAKAKITETGVIPRILSKQKEGGYWENPEDFYLRAKYKGTVWQLIILAELAADGNDQRIKNACEFILENSQERQSGGFAYVGAKRGGGDHSKVLPCLTGNMVWSLIRLGYFEDKRVQQGTDWMVEYQRLDDGVQDPPKGWPYYSEGCWGKHTCHLGVVKALKALAEIPAHKRSGQVKNTIERAAEYLLKHHLYKRSHDLSRVSKPKWLRFGFPLMWDTDALEMLWILTKLGYKDDRMREAIDLVISKQDHQGKWNLESTFNGRFQVDIEGKSQPSKWVTLNALRALKRFCS